MDTYVNAIHEHSNKLWTIPELINFQNINTNSCFDFKLYIDEINYSNVDFNIEYFKEKTMEQSIIIDMYPTNKQSFILQKWLYACTLMYNLTIQLIKEHIHFNKLKHLKKLIIENHDIDKYLKQIKKDISTNKKLYIESNKKKNISGINKIKIILSNLNKEKNIYRQIKNSNEALIKEYNKVNNYYTNYKSIRTYCLKQKRDEISVKSSDIIKERIKAHILDCTIKQACASYKSAITNFLEENIKKFRIRYWKPNKNNKIIEFEPTFITNNQLCPNVLGSIKYKYNKKPYIYLILKNILKYCIKKTQMNINY
jgi:hypothetical protein